MKLNINVDQNPQNPREFDNVSEFIFSHRKYTLGDEHAYEDISRSQLEKKYAVVVPVYMYDHSGLTLSTVPFSCQWDSGCVGFACVSREKILKESNRIKLTKVNVAWAHACVRAEVEVYSAYLGGDCYEWEIVHDNEVIDSCGGYYSYEDAHQEGKEALAYCINHMVV